MARKTKEVKVEAVNPVMVKEVLPTLAEMTTDQLMDACKNEAIRIQMGARMMVEAAHKLGKFLNELQLRTKGTGTWADVRAKAVGKGFSKATLSRYQKLACEPLEDVSGLTLTQAYKALGLVEAKEKAPTIDNNGTADAVGRQKQENAQLDLGDELEEEIDEEEEEEETEPQTPQIVLDVQKLTADLRVFVEARTPPPISLDDLKNLRSVVAEMIGLLA